jgi:hypothetical protein
MGVTRMIEQKCATCGKAFIPAPQHALRDERGFYCKPTCFLHRAKAKKPCGRGRTAHKVAQYTKDGKIVKVYESAKQIEVELGFDAKNLRAHIYQKRPYRGYVWEFID